MNLVTWWWDCVVAQLTGWRALIESGAGIPEGEIIKPLEATAPEGVTRWGCPRRYPQHHRSSS